VKDKRTEFPSPYPDSEGNECCDNKDQTPAKKLNETADSIFYIVPEHSEQNNDDNHQDKLPYRG
jgi:hypothetical protein